MNAVDKVINIKRNMRPIILSISWAFFIFYSCFAHSEMEVGNLNNIDAGIWSGQTLMSGNDDVCVRADFCIDLGFFKFCFPINYGVTLQGQGAGGAFVLSNGSEDIPLRVYFNDVAGITDRVELSPGVAITNQAGAQRDSCGADNGNFSVEIDMSDLLNVSAGNYQGIFDFEFENVAGDLFNGQFIVDITLADMVQITGVDDLGLTPSNIYIQGGDDFCVYRNGGASYAVNVSSSNSASAGIFTMSTGSDTVNYQVYYDDSVGAGSSGVLLTEGNQTGGFNGSGTYSPGCISQNASIYVRAQADLFQRFGNYSDVLTIEIVPE